MKKFLLTTLGILVLLNCNNLSIASDEHYFYVKNDNYSVSSNSINDINNINKYYSFISYICDEFSILQKLFHQTNFDTIIITHKTMLDNNLDKIIDYYSCYFSAEETNIRKLKQLLDKYNYKDILNNIKIKGPYFVPYQFINEALTKKT